MNDHPRCSCVAQQVERSATYSPPAQGCGKIAPVFKSASGTFPTTGGSFWRDRTVDLLLVASSGCTPARHDG